MGQYDGRLSNYVKNDSTATEGTDRTLPQVLGHAPRLQLSSQEPIDFS